MREQSPHETHQKKRKEILESFNLGQEQANDFHALANLHEAINLNAGPSVTRQLFHELIDEIERTHALYQLLVRYGN